VIDYEHEDDDEDDSMERVVRSVGIVANTGREAAIACARTLYEFLAVRDVRVRFASDLAELLGLPELGVGEGELGRCDLLAALGGDGTLLAANRVASPHATPVVGIHFGGPGSFGFLTETGPDGACEALEKVLAGRYQVEERLMVGGRATRDGTVVAELSALNEIVIRAQARMLKMRVAVQGTYIATYAADGIMVASPTGSTGYNLAAGGPLVHPGVETLLLTPICPHTLNVRSLLAPADHRIEVVLESGERDVTLMTVDGQLSHQLEPQDQVVFFRSPQRARFVSLGVDDFYAKVQTRLRLGERFGS